MRGDHPSGGQDGRSGDGAPPPGSSELLRIPGLGPKRAELLQRELGVRSVADLRRAAEAGRLRDLPGFGARLERRLLASLSPTAPERPAITRPETAAAHERAEHVAPAGATAVGDRDGAGRAPRRRHAPPAPPPPPRRAWGVKAFLADVLLVAGILLLTDAALTVAWEDPVSAVYTGIVQDRLSNELDDVERTERERQRRVERAQREARARSNRSEAAAAERKAVAEGLRSRARAFARRTDHGDPLGRIDIEKIGLEDVFVQGADDANVRTGPGHYPETGLPGGRRTVGIAGHRTTYSAPFRHIDELRPGDEVTLDMPYGRFRYAVQRSEIVSPDAIEVLRPVGYERLVLTACHPLYSAAQRIIVYARLTQDRFASAADVPEEEQNPLAQQVGPDYDFDSGPPEGPVLVVVLFGLISGIVGASASAAALAAPGRKPDHLLASLACSLFAVTGLTLLLLGVIG
jgi:sortase A